MLRESTRLDGWTTRYGLIMAMAGNAVGLGNFLRFPAKAEPFGAVFMIPYLVALLLLGIPLMWVEWSIGRRGGERGHGSAPGMFESLWSHPAAKYLGVLGILLPAGIGLYYVYIESWSLGYAWKTATGEYWGQATQDEMGHVFNTYLGAEGSGLSFGAQSYGFFILTLVLNLIVFARGIERGIEVVAKYAMPVLLVLGVVLAIRVFTLAPVDGRSALDGWAHFWRLDWSALANPDIWITATGQIFFTLSLGFGTIHTYASYLSRKDDIVANGLITCGTNEFVEVVLGSSIIVPAAVIFFGPVLTSSIVQSGTFAIGFHTLPVIFQQTPGGQFFGTMWFVLLFLAGLTSSVCMFTPLLLFLVQELRMSKRAAVATVTALIFALMQPVVLGMNYGVLDELDYWVGTFFLIVFAATEAVLFAWVFGMKRGWADMHDGADMPIPKIYYPILKYVTPALALGLLGWWMVDGMVAKLAMEGVAEDHKPVLWMTRIGIVLAWLAIAYGVARGWKGRRVEAAALAKAVHRDAVG